MIGSSRSTQSEVRTSGRRIKTQTDCYLASGGGLPLLLKIAIFSNFGCHLTLPHSLEDTVFHRFHSLWAHMRLCKTGARWLRSTGACTINRPCAQQYVGKSQSCMVISGRLIVHAPVSKSRVSRSLVRYLRKPASLPS